MTDKQKELVHNLRETLFKLGYPHIYAVDNETLEAVEANLTEWLISKNMDPILQCGKYGLFFKSCELVLKA